MMNGDTVATTALRNLPSHVHKKRVGMDDLEVTYALTRNLLSLSRARIVVF